MFDYDKLKYNFHSHTYRCGHAVNEEDSRYIKKAISNKYLKYGITDHVPVYPLFYTDTWVRMNDSIVDEYLYSIDNLKRKYGDKIEIFSGFEAEYDEIIEKYLCSLKDKCDYMILGQHYILNKNIRTTPEYPIEYAKKVCSAIESGIFDIIAHPDIFMQFRLGLSKDNRELFEKNAVVASKMIIDKAKEYDIPLELNLGATQTMEYQDEDDDYQNVRYPTKLFWDMVIENGNSAVIGIDAHSSLDIGLRDAKLETISRYINLDKINFLPNSYDPVSARSHNKKLVDAYEKTKSNLTSIEGRLISSFLEDYKDNDYCNFLLRENEIEKEYKPNRLFIYDDITNQKKEELSSVIISAFNDCDFSENNKKNRENLEKYIDSYYEKKEEKVNLRRIK